MDVFDSVDYDNKQSQLQTSLFDPTPSCSYSLTLERPQTPQSSTNEHEPISSNNGFMEFICHLQGEVNDLKTENVELKAQLKRADERLAEIEKRLKINKRELPAVSFSENIYNFCGLQTSVFTAIFY